MKKYTQSEISKILKNHKLWVESYQEKGKRADLQGADLQGADLRGANLQWADLQGADLRGTNLQRADLQRANLQRANLQGTNLQRADLQRANLDFSCWPLWCGSSNVKIDEKQAKQLFAHVLSVASKWIRPTKKQIEFANGFHRIQSKKFPKIKG
jgi:hypothetical protein